MFETTAIRQQFFKTTAHPPSLPCLLLNPKLKIQNKLSFRNQLTLTKQITAWRVLSIMVPYSSSIVYKPRSEVILILSLIDNTLQAVICFVRVNWFSKSWACFGFWALGLVKERQWWGCALSWKLLSYAVVSTMSCILLLILYQCILQLFWYSCTCLAFPSARMVNLKLTCSTNHAAWTWLFCADWHVGLLKPWSISIRHLCLSLHCKEMIAGSLWLNGYLILSLNTL